MHKLRIGRYLIFFMWSRVSYHKVFSWFEHIHGPHMHVLYLGRICVGIQKDWRN